MRFDFYHQTLTTTEVTTDFSAPRIWFESQCSTYAIYGVKDVNRPSFFLLLQFYHVSFHTYLYPYLFIH